MGKGDSEERKEGRRKGKRDLKQKKRRRKGRCLCRRRGRKRVGKKKLITFRDGRKKKRKSNILRKDKIRFFLEKEKTFVCQEREKK